MNRIPVFLGLFLSFVSMGHAGDILSSGDWTQFINASNLVSGAGSNLTSQYESAPGTTILTISNTTGSWRVQARKSDVAWNGSFSLWVKRTSNGNCTGTISISGGTSYVELTSVDVDLFTGFGRGCSNVALQYKLTGMSISASPNTYGSLVVFTLAQ